MIGTAQDLALAVIGAAWLIFLITWPRHHRRHGPLDPSRQRLMREMNRHE